MRAFEQQKPKNPDNSNFFGPKIQKKLKTGTVGDKYEVEADHVADKVVNNNSSNAGLLQSKEEVQQKPISETISSVQAKEMEEEPVQKKSGKKEEEKPIQAKCAECEKEDKVQKKEQKEEEKPVQAKCEACEKEDKVQKKEQNSKTEVNSELEEKLDNSKGGGTGLDKKIKIEMESGFGSDFSNVKIHTDASAVQMSQDLGAQAFTNGNDVYFNKGKYNPGSKEGKHLLAHELTHTVQQTGMVQKSTVSNLNQSEDLKSESPNPQLKGVAKLEQVHDDQSYLANGSSRLPVERVQDGLTRLGFELPQYGIDGVFGNETKQAVLDFQDTYGLSYDGIVGEQTIGLLDDIHAKKQTKKRKPCKEKKNNTAPFSEKFTSEKSVPFISTESCFKVRVNIKAKCITKDCQGFDISIDRVPGTKKSMDMQADYTKSEGFDFEMVNPGDHNLIFSMPESCKGGIGLSSSLFHVSGTIKVSGNK